MSDLVFDLLIPEDENLRVLCLGAHADDIEIGCGGTVLKLLQLYPSAEFDWVVFSSNPERSREAEEGAEAFLREAITRRIEVHAFEDGFLPYRGMLVKREFEALKSRVSPHLILTHWEGDRHQDHRLVSELTWNTFRDHPILEYEIPKYDGDLGRPNVYVPLDRETLNQKIELLVDCYQTQRDKHWFSDETFRSLARLRGMECRTPSGHAEAFYARKLILLES